MDRKFLHGACWASNPERSGVHLVFERQEALVLEAPEPEDGLGDLSSPWMGDDAADDAADDAVDAPRHSFPALHLVASYAKTNPLPIAV